MNHRHVQLLGLIALGMVLFVAGPVVAQTTASGPYYATPSWDQTLPASTRFIVLSNMNSDAVLDRETGVVWQRSPSGTSTWISANEACLGSTTGNRAGWRLPTVNELARLFDPTVTTGVPLPSGHPFTGIPAIFFSPQFWTLNLSAIAPSGYHRTAGCMYNGVTGRCDLTLIASSSDASASAYTWCVSGGLFGGQQ